MNSEISQKPMETNLIAFPVVESKQAVPSIVESFGGIDLQKTPIDEKTGFYLEDSRFRKAITKESNECSVNGKDWGVIEFDLDKLKQANSKHGRKAGDQLIVWSAQEMKAMLNEIKMQGVKLILCRKDNAGDEFTGYFFDISESQSKQLREIVTRLNNPDKGNYTTIYSMTGSMRTSFDNDYADTLSQEKQFLKDNPDKLGWKLITEMRSDIDKDVNLIKDETMDNKVKEIMSNPSSNESEKRKILEELVVGNRMTRGIFDMLINFSKKDSHFQESENRNLENQNVDDHFTSIDRFISHENVGNIFKLMGAAD